MGHEDLVAEHEAARWYEIECAWVHGHATDAGRALQLQHRSRPSAAPVVGHAGSEIAGSLLPAGGQARTLRKVLWQQGSLHGKPLRGPREVLRELH